jgi:hypothetical protein
LAGAAAVGGLALGYMAYIEEAEKARQLVLDLRDAQRQLNDETTEQTNNLIDAGGKLRELRNEYGLATQQIDKYEFAIEAAGEAANQSFVANIEQAKQSISARELELKTIRALIQAQKDGTKVVLSEDEIKRLRTLQLQTETVADGLDLTKRGISERAALLSLEDELQRRLAQQHNELTGITQMRDEAIDLAVKMAEFENEIAQATEAQAVANERSAKAKKEIAEIDPFDSEAVQGELQTLRARNELQKMFYLSNAEDIDKEIQKIDDKYEVEFEKLLKLGMITGDQQMADEAANNLRIEKLNEIDELQQTHHQKQLDRISEQVNEYAAMGNAFTGSLKTFAGAVGEYLENTDRATDKSVKRLFRLEQTAAVADIAMETAKAIAGSLGLPPGVRGVTITAAGAAQTAAVLSQQPPTLHMGGMAPDETNATLLTGEAVLDRTTVRNIGGQEGIRQLQNGQTGTNNVVIIQPFKHIDRYNKSARRVAGRVHAGAY